MGPRRRVGLRCVSVPSGKAGTRCKTLTTHRSEALRPEPPRLDRERESQ